MWTREGIKTYAKDFLRKHYWKAFIVCLIFTILAGNHFRESNSTRRDFDRNNPNPTFDQYLEEGSKVPLETNYEGLNFFLRKIGLIPFAYISWILFAIFLFIFFIIGITIGSLLKVEKNRFFLKGFKGDVNIRYLFSTFNKDEFWGIVRCMLETGIYNFLWYLLLIIPGIVKSMNIDLCPIY